MPYAFASRHNTQLRKMDARSRSRRDRYFQSEMIESKSVDRPAMDLNTAQNYMVPLMPFIICLYLHNTESILLSIHGKILFQIFTLWSYCKPKDIYQIKCDHQETKEYA